MQKLENIGNINIQSNTHYSIVSICNWDIYQSKDLEKEQAKEQASNNQVTGKEQASNTDKNVKNVKNDNKYIPDLSDVEDYFFENGYTRESAKKAYNYYQESVNGSARKYWRDGNGKMIKNWKMKMRAVWFKDENKIQDKGNTNSGLWETY